MFFTNRAALSYGGISVSSNTVSGQLVSPLSLYKSASAAGYQSGGQLQYTLTVVNTSDTPYPALTLTDNLGVYPFQTATRFPLSYVDGSASLTAYGAGGINSLPLTVTAVADGIRFSFDMPASATALLLYTAQTTVFAPPAAGSEIVNTATLGGDYPLLPTAASLSLPAAVSAQPVISKCVSSETISPGQQVTFTLTLSNYGNYPITASDYVVISDTLSPPLTGVSVYADGLLWTQGVQYDYSESAAYFITQPGAIALPAATFTRDDFGSWSVTPSSLVIKISGTAAF